MSNVTPLRARYADMAVDTRAVSERELYARNIGFTHHVDPKSFTAMNSCQLVIAVVDGYRRGTIVGISIRHGNGRRLFEQVIDRAKKESCRSILAPARELCDTLRAVLRCLDFKDDGGDLVLHIR